MNDSAINTLPVDLDKLWEWAVENAVQIYSVKSKAESFMRAGVKDPLNYFWGGPKNSGSESLQIFGNNLTQRFKLG